MEGVDLIAGVGLNIIKENLPCLTKVWLVSRRISQPSTIILSMARFFLMFSVSLTSSCITLKMHKTHYFTSLHFSQKKIMILIHTGTIPPISI